MSIPICIVGTIATDPRFSRTSSRVAFCSFRVASNERRFDREQAQWVDGETNWFTVNAFRGLAEHASESFAKGDRVVVSGRIRMRRWESGEKSGTAVEIEAEAFGHDLRWGVSSFAKRHGAGAESAGGLSESGEQTAWRVASEERAGAEQEAPSSVDAEGDGFEAVAA
ncbi:single-stranded DNA-binding protein [Leucobacter sp.]